MRISSINVTLPRNYNYESTMKEAQAPRVSMEQPSFKSLKGGFFAAVGALAGAAVGTILTGGVMAPFLLAGAGTIIGGGYGNQDESSEDENGFPLDNELSSFDYLA